MGGWQFALPALSAWIALLEADAVLVGQWMFSRPVFLGPLTGLLCGDLWTGLALGGLAELFSAESLPVGTSMPFNASVAAGCSVLLSAGAWAVPMPAAFPAGLALGFAHRRIETLIRHRRSTLTSRVARSLTAGEPPDWTGLLLRSVGTHVLATAAFVYLTVALLGPALSWSWDAAAVSIRDALKFAFAAGPWLGMAALLRGFLRRA